MKKIIAIILTVASICTCGLFTAPAIMKAIQKKQADEELKKPLTEEVVLLEAAKTPEELGVKNISLKFNGTGGSLALESGTIKFEAGCGADSFTVNVEEYGSTTLAYEHQSVYTADSRYETYRLKSATLTPYVMGSGEKQLTVKIFARVGDRMYLIGERKATLEYWDIVWELGENELPPVWIN